MLIKILVSIAFYFFTGSAVFWVQARTRKTLQDYVPILMLSNRRCGSIRCWGKLHHRRNFAKKRTLILIHIISKLVSNYDAGKGT